MFVANRCSVYQNRRRQWRSLLLRLSRPLVLHPSRPLVCRHLCPLVPHPSRLLVCRHLCPLVPHPSRLLVCRHLCPLLTRLWLLLASVRIIMYLLRCACDNTRIASDSLITAKGIILMATSNNGCLRSLIYFYGVVVITALIQPLHHYVVSAHCVAISVPHAVCAVGDLRSRFLRRIWHVFALCCG